MTPKIAIIILSILFLLVIAIITIAYFVTQPPVSTDSTQLPTKTEESQGILSPKEKKQEIINKLESLRSSREQDSSPEQAQTEEEKRQEIIKALEGLRTNEEDSTTSSAEGSEGVTSQEEKTEEEKRQEILDRLKELRKSKE